MPHRDLESIVAAGLLADHLADVAAMIDQIGFRNREAGGTRGRSSIRVIDLADFHGVFIKAVQQARVDAHFSEVLP